MRAMRPSVVRTGLLSGAPVRALPVDNASMAIAVTVVHTIPSRECRG